MTELGEDLPVLLEKNKRLQITNLVSDICNPLLT